MSKAEQFFNTVDFSVETDFKERLRKQLFESSEGSISEQSLHDNKAAVHKKKESARELSLDELEMVNAAGNIAMQEKTFINEIKYQYKRLKSEIVIYTDEIPETISGKIRRVEIRENDNKN